MGPCLAATIVGLLAAPPGAVVEGGLARRLDRHLSRLVPFGFAGTVLMARGDDVRLHRGYGWADPGARVPETTRTLHAIGSLSKAFTAAAILRLEADGKLSTRDPLGRLLPGVPADKTAITLHQLLTHTAGIVEATYGNGLEAEWVPRARDDVIAEILGEPLQFHPGDGFGYSNAGYTLLAAVVERVSGLAFETYLRQRMLAPAGIEEIGTRVPGWDFGRFPHVLAGDEDRGTLVTRLGLDRQDPPALWNLVGNSGLQATALDLHRWVRALRTGRVLPESAVARMFDGGKHAYGYGWEVMAIPGGSRVLHHVGGHYLGTNAEIRVDEASETVLIVLCDRLVDARVTWTTSLRPALLALLAGREPKAAPLVREAGPGELEAWAGTWGDARGPALLARVRGGRLRVQPLRDDVTSLLVGPDARTLTRMGVRAAEVVQGWLRGKAPEDRALQPLIEAAVTPAGEEPKVSAGPTVPDVGGAFVTTTWVRGAAGAAALHLRWKDGVVLAVHRRPLVVEVPFLPDARRPGVLAGHHPYLDGMPEIHLVQARSGPIAIHLGGRAFRRL